MFVCVAYAFIAATRHRVSQQYLASSTLSIKRNGVFSFFRVQIVVCLRKILVWYNRGKQEALYSEVSVQDEDNS